MSAKAVLTVFLASLLMGCGKKGPLYRPEPATAAPPALAAPVSDRGGR